MAKDLERFDTSSVASDSSSNSASVTNSWYSPERWHPDRNAVIRNVIIGFLDGLTVPFAVAAGLTNLRDSKMIVFGGLSELVSGSMAMALAAYLAEVTAQQRFDSQAKRLQKHLNEMPFRHDQQICLTLGEYGIGNAASKAVAEDLQGGEHRRLKFIMDLTFESERPRTSQAVLVAFSMGMAYFVGGMVTMAPYFITSLQMMEALIWSSVLSAISLVVFGYWKNWLILYSHRGALGSAFQILVFGVIIAGVTYGIAMGMDSHDSRQRSKVPSSPGPHRA